MQAKIIDFASDKIVKSLQKIEKNDVKNAFSNLSSKLSKKGKKRAAKKNAAIKESNEEGCELLKNESYKDVKKSEKVISIEDDECSSVDGSSIHAP